ncbi:MAG: hypothetical protein GY866_19155 [Proteobacteria bacterium]|nr:hypothetical protein [Pseudomonadota bacterium]
MMKTHQDIDKRSLLLAKAIVSKIESDPRSEGRNKAIENCERRCKANPSPAVLEWLEILQSPWSNVKKALLDESGEGKRLRQSNPFCGILTPQERWQIYKKLQKGFKE